MPLGDLQITANLVVPEELLQERFVRAQGPGGQHVNKSSTAVELRFDPAACPDIPDGARERLAGLAGSRMTQEGVIVLFSQEHSSQQLNREAARERLAALIRAALVRPKTRRATRPTLASKQRRLEGKARRSGVKAGRGRPPTD